MTPARLIPIVFLYLFSGASIACTFRDTRNNAVYELNLSEAECRTISYIDGPIIPMRLSYPEGKVVDSAWRGETIHLLLYHVDSTHRLDRMRDGASYIRSIGDLDVYKDSSEEFYLLRGSDSARIFIKERGYTWLAKRMYSGVLIQYQYDRRLTNFATIDNLIMAALEHMLGRQGEQ